MNIKDRYTIQGTLTTNAALHIGSGAYDLADTDQNDGSTTGVALVATDFEDAPIIPGASLKGVLRAWARQTNVAELDAIFGSLATAKGTKRGSATFHTAFANKTLGQIKQERDTFHARDRHTKAVANQKLFTQNVLPVNSVFDIRIDIEEVDAETAKKNVNALLNALEGFDGSVKGIALGKSTASGNGTAKWTCKGVHHTTCEAARHWFKKRIGSNQERLEQTDVTDLFKANGRAHTRSDQLVIEDFTIHIDGPFLVNANKPKEKGSKDPDFTPKQRADGKYELPGRSLHGALRSQAERICNTLGIPIQTHQDADYSAADIRDGKIDVVSALFGTTGWKSPLTISALTCAETTPIHQQEFVAIDRFTGGAADGAKFWGRSVLSPQLLGHVSLDLTRIRAIGQCDKAIGLLSLLLRDLDEGDVSLGFGAASKGYGRVNGAKMETVLSLNSALNKLGAKVRKEFELTDIAGAVNSFVSAMAAGPLSTEAATGAELPEYPTGATPRLVRAKVDAAATQFHNPYSFIPVLPVDKTKVVRMSDLANVSVREQLHHWHNKYSEKDAKGRPVFSGTIRCSLRTVTPLVLGGTRTEGAPSQILPFRLGDEIAIPATSLRGMIGSVIESVSNSALRVLNDAKLSVRMDLKKGEVYPQVGVVHEYRDGLWWVKEEKSNKLHVVSAEALERFLSIARDRAEKTRDAREEKARHPRARKPGDRLKDSKFQSTPELREGQMVFFEAIMNASTNRSEIVRFSWAKSWRNRIESRNTDGVLTAFGVHAFFSNIDKELLPFSSKRTTISPAEWMLGFVSTDAPPSQENSPRSINSFAGKLRFSSGRGATPFGDEVLEPAPGTTLKILASPKLPSPAMYFARKDSKFPYLQVPGHVSKRELASDPRSFVPHGRKVYLHALRKEKKVVGLDAFGEETQFAVGTEPWRASGDSKFDNQRVRVRPIKADTEFHFQIDFDNLAQDELELLCFSLRSNAGFEHRLGLGKPLGLGSVSVNPVAIQLIDRKRRYMEDPLSTNRTNSAAVVNVDLVAGTGRTTFLNLTNFAASLSDPEVLRILCSTGSGNGVVQKPVHTPQLAGQKIEEESFAWFVDNERDAQSVSSAKQSLYPLWAVPLLNRNKRQ
jgi:CRISPR/Cas system CSM-associated protein Csm3 (group 7 of RAMP superfamily)